MISNDTSASNYVYKYLFDEITSLRLTPGTRINPNKLSQKLKISRTPIQSACSKLAENKLLKIKPQSGSYVSLINFSKVYESFYMRNLLEQAAIYEVCHSSNRPKVVLALEQNIYNQQKALEQGLYDNAFNYDNKFHHIIYSVAKMIYIEESMVQISIDQKRIDKLKILSNIRPYPILKEHQEILNSIRDGNSDAAKFNVYMHISNMIKNTIIIHNKYSNYFSNWIDKKSIKTNLEGQKFYNLKS